MRYPASEKREIIRLVEMADERWQAGHNSLPEHLQVPPHRLSEIHLKSQTAAWHEAGMDELTAACDQATKRVKVIDRSIRETVAPTLHGMELQIRLPCTQLDERRERDRALAQVIYEGIKRLRGKAG